MTSKEVVLLEQLLTFIRQLDEANVWYQLESVRNAIVVVVATPGKRWEVEFFEDGRIEVEWFISTGEIEGKDALPVIFEEASR